jgi:drug/metabolite transporter (DMT)-like permease
VTTPVYSADRVRRLRLVLLIVSVIAVVLAVLAAFILVSGDNRSAGAVAVVVAGLLLGSTGVALRLLPERGRPAKVATIVTAVVCVLSGVGLAGSWLAFLLPLLGLGLLFLALVADDPEHVS